MTRSSDTENSLIQAGTTGASLVRADDSAARIMAASVEPAHKSIDELGGQDFDARIRELLAKMSAADVSQFAEQVAILAGSARALEALSAIQHQAAQLRKSLPAPTRAVVVDFFAALATEDIDYAVDLVSADGVWSIPGDPVLLPWVGVHRGRDAIREFYRTLHAETENESLELGPVVCHGEFAYVRGEFAYSFPRGGHYAGAFVIVLTVRGGLIERYEMYEDSLGLARAFGNAS